ncbi:MAG: fibrillarin-like rRNA/tRNA 2'-O-methyltransferase [Candidatus Micrarchaeaceae archaeon]
MDINTAFEGVYKINNKLATKNLTPGIKVYDEELIKVKNTEYRLWNPYRSKLAASIINGLSELNIKKGSQVLYLGASTGTTVSHVSDIIEEGNVFAVEISKRSMRDLLTLCEKRENILPIFEDALNTDSYLSEVGEVDIIYEDVAAPTQDKILIKNAELLKKGGSAYVAIKSQSIDVSKDPKVVFEEFIKNISHKFKVVQRIKIEPFDKLHLFLHLKKL